MTAMVTSADGTRIGYDRTGDGPAIVLVHGAFTDKTHPTLATVAAALAPWFRVFNYDRRGRGESGDTRPYAVEREVEDLAAVIAAAGGSAMVFGGSSGSGLVLQAAFGGLPITRLALWEPPYHVDETAPPLSPDFADRLGKLVDSGRAGDAVAMFMTEAAQVPTELVAIMRADPVVAGQRNHRAHAGVRGRRDGTGQRPAGRAARDGDPQRRWSSPAAPARHGWSMPERQ
ncbi:alpha/beta fold hydrolase [Fodinicola feengrottensis]|uniref:alpha/beta fold hydrolase n=1 Tax=Fodinicola feengrottensis TaxID=435914 RepID=UPI0013D70A88|nr:alpha/beta hydrolase [Fodinicola feengrottensis]